MRPCPPRTVDDIVTDWRAQPEFTMSEQDAGILIAAWADLLASCRKTVDDVTALVQQDAVATRSDPLDLTGKCTVPVWFPLLGDERPCGRPIREDGMCGVHALKAKAERDGS